jgi:transposase
MSSKYTQAFKQQAVEKALRHGNTVTLQVTAAALGIARSTLYKWINQAKHSACSTPQDDLTMTKTHEKRPQDWSLEERFQMIVSCAAPHWIKMR